MWMNDWDHDIDGRQKKNFIAWLVNATEHVRHAAIYCCEMLDDYILDMCCTWRDVYTCIYVYIFQYVYTPHNALYVYMYHHEWNIAFCRELVERLTVHIAIFCFCRPFQLYFVSIKLRVL